MAIDPVTIDGRPTFFRTWIGEKAEDDVDARVSLDTLLTVNPASVFNGRVGSAEVRVIL